MAEHWPHTPDAGGSIPPPAIFQQVQSGKVSEPGRLRWTVNPLRLLSPQRFKSSLSHHSWAIVQLVERLALNQEVDGSIPSRPATERRLIMRQVKVNGKMVDIHPNLSPVRAVDILDLAMAQGAMPRFGTWARKPPGSFNVVGINPTNQREYYLHESIVRKEFHGTDIVDTQKYNQFLTLRDGATTVQ